MHNRPQEAPVRRGRIALATMQVIRICTVSPLPTLSNLRRSAHPSPTQRWWHKSLLPEKSGLALAGSV
jgi:hypothetical protein